MNAAPLGDNYVAGPYFAGLTEEKLPLLAQSGSFRLARSGPADVHELAISDSYLASPPTLESDCAFCAEVIPPTRATLSYQDIHELLTGLGFSLEARVPERSVEVEPPRKTLVYRHEKQGTVLKFPSNSHKPALQGEILSLRAHLVGNGHLTDEAFLGFLDRGAVRT